MTSMVTTTAPSPRVCLFFYFSCLPPCQCQGWVLFFLLLNLLSYCILGDSREGGASLSEA